MFSVLSVAKVFRSPRRLPWADIARSIGDATGGHFSIERKRSLGGGDINAAWRIAGGGRAFFLKVNARQRLPMFEAEAAGLAEIAATRTVRVPQPVCAGAGREASWLALEYLELRPGNAAGKRELGRRIARMHRAVRDRFGWDRDNTIGATPQVNSPSADWLAFWRERRLRFQLDLAAQRGCGGRLREGGARLLEALPAFFAGYTPVPSLLHGDLWGGNAGFDADGGPVIYDPAVYYGDREADIAMTELFGGFGAEFRSGYHDEFPLDPGYPRRRDLYNLYHVLNHLNLFGGTYGAQAERMIERLLAEVTR